MDEGTNTRERYIRIAILLFGVGQLGLGIWQAISPGSFFRSIGGFGAENSHFIRDVATLYLALGLVLVVAARRPSWRVPVLVFALLQYSFHLVNHVLDLGKSNPTWAGPADVASLALAAAILLILLLAARSETG